MICPSAADPRMSLARVSSHKPVTGFLSSLQSRRRRGAKIPMRSSRLHSSIVMAFLPRVVVPSSGRQYPILETNRA